MRIYVSILLRESEKSLEMLRQKAEVIVVKIRSTQLEFRNIIHECDSVIIGIGSGD